MGHENISEIIINGVRTKSLVDTGSQISTISEGYLKHLNPVPEIRTLDELELDVKCADGQSLQYKGYVAVDVQSTFSENQDDYPPFPLLVVPTIDYHEKVPVIVGTNIISRLKERNLESCDVPHTWQLAFSSVANNSVGVVKSTTHVTLQPMEVKTVTGLVRKKQHVESAITEQMDSNITSKATVCPRVVSLNNPGKTSRVPVRLCNMSARTLKIPPKSNLCDLHEVKVLRSPSVAQPSDNSDTVNIKQQRIVDDGDDDDDQPEVDLDASVLTEEQKHKVRMILNKWQNIFSKGPTDLGCTNLVEHEIHLENEDPFKDPYRRIPPALIQEVREHLNEMIEAGAIRPSKSPFSSNVVIARKKDGSIRFCIDYRKLNQRTVKDAYAIPRVDDTLQLLAGAKYFSTLDLKSGYWQVEVKEADKAKTTFQVGSLGFYECNRMPFGLCNAPATFQRLMERCMGDLNLRDCLIYLDDIIIFSTTFEEHLERLQAVFARLQDHNLKLKPVKCNLFRRKVSYLGHVVSEAGIHTDPNKIDAIQNWPVPNSVREVRRFLGFAGYYRRFIKGFASIVRPLNDLLVGQVTNPKARKKKSPKRVPFKWTSVQQESFETIIDRLSNPPVLAYADYSLPFKVHTDASVNGLGAVLYQNQDNKERVIAYASRSLKPSERNYPAHKLEFLALKWAVCEKFHDYLYGSQFEVITDNNPLTYVLTTAKLDATGQRWVAALSGYKFSIKYRSGKKNADADGLSRCKHPQEVMTIFPDMLKAISHSLSVMDKDCSLVESLAVSPAHVSKQILEIPEQLLQTYGLTFKDWRKAQLSDPCIGFILNKVETGSKAPAKRTLDQAVDARYLREWDKLFVSQGVLHRKVSINEQDFQQLVLPPVFRQEVFQALHDDLGHQGRDRTTSLFKQRFFWPGMDAFVKESVRACDQCIGRKAVGGKSAELVNITSSSPMEIVCLDYLSLERSKSGHENILVITDHFSRYAQAIPTRNQTAKTTARVLFDNFIVNYGFPARIHSDQGQNFESHLIKELCQIARVEKSRTTPYHPMGNGQVERFNQTLLKMLGTLEEYQKSDWKSHVPTLVHAYNATFHNSTGFSPYFIMFGRHPRLAIDAFLGITPDTLSSTKSTEYVRKLRQRLDFAYRKAQEQAKKTGAVYKHHYDETARSSVLMLGDLVLVQKVGVKGKQKIGDKWEHDPYIVISQPNDDIPVYEVRRDNSRAKKTRLLHRTLLLPFVGLPRLDEEDFEEDPDSLVVVGDDQQDQVISQIDPGDSAVRTNSEDSLLSENDDSSDKEAPLELDGTGKRYVIPMLRGPDDPGVLPRETALPPTRAQELRESSGSSSQSSSDDEDRPRRPQRSRKKPQWMRSDDWVLS